MEGEVDRAKYGPEKEAVLAAWKLQLFQLRFSALQATVESVWPQNQTEYP